MVCACTILAGVGLLLALLYMVSEAARFYIRCSLLYTCILLHGICCMVLLIPGWLRGDGADVVFHGFYWWSRWCGIRVQVRGFEEVLKDRKEPCVVICNHQSAVDIVVMTHLWPTRGCVMMKKSLAYVPFFNLSAYLANSIFIDRFSREKAYKAIDQCADAIIERKLKLWVFPEGTRNRDGGLLPFKKGAFNIAVKAQIPIIPVVFSDYRTFYNKREKYFKSDGEVIAQVLPAIETSGKSLEEVSSLLDEAYSKMLSSFDEISKEATQLMREKREKKEQ